MLRTSARYQRVEHQPGERQVLADVVGVAIVEVGGERALRRASPVRRAARRRASCRRRRAPPPTCAASSAGGAARRVAGAARRCVRGRSACPLRARRVGALLAALGHRGDHSPRAFDRRAGSSRSAETRRGRAAQRTQPRARRRRLRLGSPRRRVADQPVRPLGQLDLRHVAALARGSPGRRSAAPRRRGARSAPGPAGRRRPRRTAPGARAPPSRDQKPVVRRAGSSR